MQSQPNSRKTWCGGGQSGRLGIEFGHAQAQGTRPHPIEDYYVAKVQPFGHGDRIGLFAIFDGHGGSQVAQYLKDNLFHAILDHPKFSTDPKQAIRESYLAVDQRILEMGEATRAWEAGSTATTAFLMDKRRRLIVVNVGDSRAVLSRGGVAIDLSVDHEPQKPQERQMIESKGGEVSRKISGDVYRVDRRLALSRAHITVEPDIWDGELSAATDEFFIIASDGLWHVMSSQEAVDLATQASGAKEAAKALIHAAVDRLSQDDISVLVINIRAVE